MRRFISAFFVAAAFPAFCHAAEFSAKEIYEKISPSVVVIRGTGESIQGSLGAGAVISRDGLILTNAHLVIDKKSKKPYQSIFVYLKPDRLTGIYSNDLSKYFPAQVVHYSIDLDLALVRASGLPPAINVIELADASEIKVGEEVVAIGHPEQGGFWSLTYGRISGEMTDYEAVRGKDVFQTDTSINRGNSGGPLLDRRGYLVAVNSNIARLGNDGIPITGVNFAIKSSVVKQWLSKLRYQVAYGKQPLVEPHVVIAAKPPETSGAKEPDIQKSKKQEEAKATVKTEEIKPQKKPEEKKAELKVQEKKPEPTQKETKAAPQRPEDKFLTPKRPYDYDALIKAAEKDLEKMIDEMRGRTRGRP